MTCLSSEQIISFDAPSERLLRTEGDAEAKEKRKKEKSDAAAYGNQKFCWNNRVCYGNTLHLAVLQGDLQAVTTILDSEDAHVWDRFAYMTEFKGKPQECSGCPVHLAASRDHIEVLELLLSRHASLDSHVRRGSEDNYDVIQAAVFSEGRGGSKDMIDLLIFAGSSIASKNANGYTCMHLAFQTGNMETISAVRRHARQSNTLRFFTATDDSDDEENSETKVKSPLCLGIEMGKMDKYQLASAASPRNACLKTFIHRAPECIPMFLSRILGAGMATPEDLAENLSRKDIASLLRTCPEAAYALLVGITAKPEETSIGWHPLPTRVSFGPRRKVERWLRNILPKKRFIVFYQDEKSWDFDDACFEAPEWHKGLTDRGFGRPFYDAAIRVCHVPNIISPDFFAALNQAAEDGALFLFESITVRAAVSYTFWNGALWVDWMQFTVSLWGLTLILVETWFMHEEAVALWTSGVSKVDGVQEGHYVDGVFTPSLYFWGRPAGRVSVVADWIVAKGLVDCFLELTQLIGCIKINQPLVYANFGNLWDIFRSITPVMLIFDSSSRFLHLLIVLIYWVRLLEGVTYTEKVGHALLPIKKLASGLLPALSFTVVGYCGLTHAMYTVQEDPHRLWPDTEWKSFSTLITQGLPEKAPSDTLELLVMYAGVSFFSVFVLNIFIGVIGEEYSHEKERVSLMFQNVRTSSCLTFLLRTLVLPCNLYTAMTAFFIAKTCVVTAVVMQVLALGWDKRLPGTLQLWVFLLCQVGLLLSTLQCKDQSHPWSDCQQWTGNVKCSNKSFASSVLGQKKYLWMCTSSELDQDGFENDSKKGKSTEKIERMISRQNTGPQGADVQELSQPVLTQLRKLIREELTAANEGRGRVGPISSTGTAHSNVSAPGKLPTLLGNER
mmetsp:Transcript_11764/g.20833  ORF Transcript_11764/g.20833 Transcript_11764/m.20833 type:complete len:899 (-) Transcript_11764:46-2742(-)